MSHLGRPPAHRRLVAALPPFTTATSLSQPCLITASLSFFLCFAIMFSPTTTEPPQTILPWSVRPHRCPQPTDHHPLATRPRQLSRSPAWPPAPLLDYCCCSDHSSHPSSPFVVPF
ncbi:hypothetical protein NL676_014407 [Syzygium grande]|nr:hypothetical protein NL676_014407 [Syzygium grande]